jgi:hypothetical protein
MSGLDSCIMSDLQVWITLAALGSAVLVFVPALGVPAWAERRGNPRLVVVAFLVAAALGGFAWYSAPTSTAEVPAFVAIADRG